MINGEFTIVPPKYRVLQFITRGFIGGQERALYQLLKVFRDNDFELGVAIGQNEGLYVKKIRELDIPIIDLGLNSGYMTRFDKRKLKRLREYHIHHFHDPSPNVILMSILSGLKVKRMFTRRGGDMDYFDKYGPKVRLKYVINKMLIRKFFNGYSGNTKHAADFVRQFYGITDKKIHVLYNGIDFQLLKPTLDKRSVLHKFDLDESAYKIGTACHLIGLKRVDLIIKAFSKCCINRKKLLVFGRGSELHNLKGLVKSLNLDNQVIFAGEVTNMPDYMQILDCFILASGKEESFGNAVVEAMYSRIPSIIMNDSEGLKEHITDNETGFIAKDDMDLVHKIEYIFEVPAEAKRIAENASAYVFNKYSTENMVNAYKQFYYDILSTT